MNLRSLIQRASRFARRKLRHFGEPRLTSVQSISQTSFAAKIRYNTAQSKSESADECMSGLLSRFGDRLRGEMTTWLPQLTDLRLDLARMSDAQIIERADAALIGDIHPSGVRPILDSAGRIDWHTNPAESREWLLMMHRHAWWTLWGVAYQKTKDEKYAKAFVSQLVDWIDKNPMPGRKSENSEAWRLMEVGLRARISWIPAFGLFYDSPEFDNSVKLKMLRGFYDHGQMLCTFFTNRNHLVRESNGLLALGLNFPEFDVAEKWIDAATSRIDNELAQQINADGSQIEMSVGYQWLSVDEFNVTYQMLREHNMQLPTEDIENVLARMVEHLAIVSRPDGSFPQLNDGFILWTSSDLATLGQDLGLSAVEYVGSGGLAGSVPEYCSRSLPNAGLHVMRSDWSATAHWSVFDTGPFGGPHGHEDKLSFELFAYGVPFIVDPGSYTYRNTDPYREYFVSSRGHNTVLVDGCSQVRRWDGRHILPTVNSTHHGTWQSDTNVDFASGTYTEEFAPYAMHRSDDVQPISDVVHQRDMVYVRQEFWVVVDYLDSPIVRNYDFLFHLSPTIVPSVRSDGSVLLRSDTNGAQMLMFPIARTDLSCDIVRGSETPIQGWFSPDHHQKEPSSTLIYGAREANLLVAAWIFYPLAGGTDANCVNAKIVATENKSELEFEVSTEGQISTIAVLEKLGANSNGDEQRQFAVSIANSAGEESWQVQCCGSSGLQRQPEINKV